ncbi:hypothetical protein [[Flexibacter] sp. ATCC 35103]|uniref:hypothetical protein n=1 Tax=[Flexibacter] sp. ATCC 35103 TaxID=1937528 RepID=UPI0009D094AC|nr:hypothetical protein [[Flexibacter] sp. ATCC 35103]OMQ13503.1 hypothetical protein BXU01_03225 [[Flexibacter] sp. ATCC 35103]
MEITSSNFAEQVAKYLPIPGKICQYHFSTETSNLKKVEKDWQKTERKVEITYLGKKEDFRFYQILTTKIILTSNKAFPNKALLIKIGYVFDNIEVGVTDKGFIKKIFNLHDLKLRMQEIKSHLEKDHYGEVFLHFLNGIDALLQDEKKVIAFLQSFKMFGLYFNGLRKRFQESIPNLIVKPRVLDDFGQLEIQEEIIFEENNNNYTFTVKEKSEEQKTEKYKAIYKTEYNQLLVGFIEVESKETNIKYNLSWVG